MSIGSINWNGKMQQDDLFPASEMKSIQELTGLPGRKGMEMLIVSGGTVVNAVSKDYGHMLNENFFLKVEEKLIENDIHYKTRSINRDNRSFICDYIIDDDNFIVEMKSNGTKKFGERDIIRPMMRFITSYDGSCMTGGNFGFFRQVCANGLNVGQAISGFSVRKTSGVHELVLPEINELINKFMDNEFFSLKKKFEKLINVPIRSNEKFVKIICDKTKLFKFEKSDKNPEPSVNAQIILDIMKNEQKTLGQDSSLWLGYNAFNSLIHNKLSRSFDEQKKLDEKVFETIYGFAPVS